MTPRKVTATHKHAKGLLRTILDGKTELHFRNKQIIFSAGDKSDALYFIETGKVKLSVLSQTGREAVLSLLGPGEFFGESCLAGESARFDTATALDSSTIFRIEKRAMLYGLRTVSELCQNFTAAILLRNLRLKEDLCDQFFNHSERRLARVLIKLARSAGPSPARDITVPRIDHETLADMVGTTRSRITHFMNKFRKEGLIDYDGKLTIRPERLSNSVLRD